MINKIPLEEHHHRRTPSQKNAIRGQYPPFKQHKGKKQQTNSTFVQKQRSSLRLKTRQRHRHGAGAALGRLRTHPSIQASLGLFISPLLKSSPRDQKNRDTDRLASLSTSQEQRRSYFQSRQTASDFKLLQTTLSRLSLNRYSRSRSLWPASSIVHQGEKNSQSTQT